MISKELRTSLILGCAIALAIPVTMLLPGLVPKAHAPSPYLIAVPGGEYDFLPMMNWCGKGDYGKLNVIVAAQKLMYDNIPGNDWYFYKVTLETVPGKIACSNSDWRTDNTYTMSTVSSPDQLVDQSPTSTNGQSSVTVTLGADSGGPNFSESYSYNIQDVTVLDNSDLSAQRAEWTHDINEQNNVPASTNTYDAYPGFVVKTPENGAALVQSTPDSNSPCDANNHGCGFRVDWGKPSWCGWDYGCGTWEYTWITNTLYFDAQMNGDSPNSPVINTIPTLSTNEGQPLSYQVTGYDPDGDYVTYSLGSAPTGVSITGQGLLTWTPGEGTEGSYWVLVNASDGYGGTASQWVLINVGEADNAQFISWTPPPSTMSPGQQATVSVTMKNTGSSTWTAAGSTPWRLAVPGTYPTDSTPLGPARQYLTSDVPPGSQYTFSWTVTAPSTAGTYNFQWQMVHEYVEWFGDQTPNAVVTVQGFTATSCGGISLQTGGYGGTCAINLSSVGGWSGTVSLSITPGTTGGPTTSLSTTSVYVPAGGTGSAYVSVVSGTSNGYFYYTVTGTSSQAHSSTTFYVYQYTPCGCGGGGGSIAYGSLITMADGSKLPVQNLRIGDKMLGYDTITGTYTVSVVNSITVVDTTNMLIIHTSYGTPFRVDANPRQTLWVKTSAGTTGWMPVTQINPGDDLWTQNGWVKVTSIEFAPAGTHVMYDIFASAPYFADGYLDPIRKM